MITALFVAIFAVLLAYVGGRSKYPTYLLRLSFVVLTIFLSLGYYWGNDVANYERWFEGFKNSDVLWWQFSQYDRFTQKEYGYIFINLLCKPLGFWWMRAILFIIENAIVCSFIIKHVDKRWYWLAVFVYVFNPNFWVLSSSMMRQWLAMCIILAGIELLLKRKYLFFTLVVVVAATIHISAIVCLLMVPLSFLFKKASIKAAYLTVLLLLIYFVLSPLLIDYLAVYLSTEELYMGYSAYTDSKDTLGVSGLIMLFLYFLMMYHAVKTCQKDYLLYTIVFLNGIVIPLSSLGALSARLGFYFSIFTISTIPSFMDNRRVNKTLRLGAVAFLCLYNIYTFYLFFNSPIWKPSFGTYHTLIGRL